MNRRAFGERVTAMQGSLYRVAAKLSARGERQARRGGGGNCQGVGKAADPSG